MALIETKDDFEFKANVEDLRDQVEKLNAQLRNVKECNDTLTVVVNKLILTINDQNDLLERLIRNQTLSN